MKNNESDDVKVYVRLNDKSVLASKETIKILRNSNHDSPPVKVSIGMIEKSLFEYLQLNEKITVKGFKNLLTFQNAGQAELLLIL